MRVQLAASMGSLSTRSAGALLASNDLVAIALLPLLVSPRSGVRSRVFLVALEMTRLQPHSGVLDCVRSFRSPSYSRGDWRFCTISPHPEVYPSRRLLMLSSRSLNGLRALLVATPVASAVAVAVLLLRARDLTEIRRDPPRLHDMCVS